MSSLWTAQGIIEHITRERKLFALNVFLSSSVRNNKYSIALFVQNCKLKI